jgi:hypothetical protein
MERNVWITPQTIYVPFGTKLNYWHYLLALNNDDLIMEGGGERKVHR